MLSDARREKERPNHHQLYCPKNFAVSLCGVNTTTTKDRCHEDTMEVGVKASR